MKTKTLLFLASFAVLTTISRAAPFTIADETVVLPTVVIAAPRFTPVEKQINTSLDAVRQLAKTPVAIPTDCPALKAVAQQERLLAQQTRDEKSRRIARL
jgi:hypothetical protein